MKHASCIATTKDGGWCLNRAVSGSQYCNRHDPNKRAENRARTLQKRSEVAKALRRSANALTRSISREMRVLGEALEAGDRLSSQIALERLRERIDDWAAKYR